MGFQSPAKRALSFLGTNVLAPCTFAMKFCLIAFPTTRMRHLVLGAAYELTQTCLPCLHAPLAWGGAIFGFSIRRHERRFLCFHALHERLTVHLGLIHQVDTSHHCAQISTISSDFKRSEWQPQHLILEPCACVRWLLSILNLQYFIYTAATMLHALRILRNFFPVFPLVTSWGTVPTFWTSAGIGRTTITLPMFLSTRRPFFIFTLRSSLVAAPAVPEHI